MKNNDVLSQILAYAACLSFVQLLEGRVTLCDKEHNLHVDLGCMKGIIPRSEGAIGIEEGYIRDIALILAPI